MESLNRTSDKPGNNWTGTGLVLLVDDDETVREVCGKMLHKMGFQVITAEHGREGVEMLRSQADEIACVLLDLSMPVMDGHQAFEIMSRIRPDVKVLIMTGYSAESVFGAFTENEPAGFISKPFRASALKAKLKRIIKDQPDALDQGYFGQLVEDTY